MRRYLFLTLTLAVFFLVMILPLPNLVSAATYYVKPDGNDSLSGQRDSTAWKTVAKVNSYKFATGDDVYFKCGGTYSVAKHLRIAWSGTAGNRVIIGAYYIDGGSETIGINGDMPVLDGEWSGGVPTSSTWKGLIHVPIGNDYVTIRDLKVYQSEHLGIKSVTCDNVTVTNVVVDYCYRQGVHLYAGNNCILENSEITRVSRQGSGACVIMQKSNGTIVRNNEIHDSYFTGFGGGGREGINFLRSDNSIAEYNVIYNNRGMGIYFDHAIGCTARYNLIYYNSKVGECWRRRMKPSSGIVFTDEDDEGDTHLARDNTAMGNLIAGCGEGITLWSGPRNAFDPGLVNVKIIGNTIVEQYSMDGSHVAIHIHESANNSNTIIKNNIFYQTSGKLANVPKDPELDFDFNLWLLEPENDAKGPNDPPYDVPKLAKTSGWNNLRPGSLEYSAFALQAGSPARNVGINLGTRLAHILECNEINWHTGNMLVIDQNSQGSRWEIGADIYIEETPLQPQPPKKLSIVQR